MISHRTQSLIFFLFLFLYSLHAARSFPEEISAEYQEAPIYMNGDQCQENQLVHIAMTLDSKYLRGSLASIHSIVKHSSCPENIHFHLIASSSEHSNLNKILNFVFPSIRVEIFPFEYEARVKKLISSSIRPALDAPLNYARIYLGQILDLSVTRVIYLDSDTIVVDDIGKLFSIDLTGSKVIGAPEYCHVNFQRYFKNEFWADEILSSVFNGKKACYFNTGVMVMDLKRWREGDYTREIEEWMIMQKEKRIYELGSLPPFLLVFGGEIESIDLRWNQHGLGGDNVANSCRSLHPGPVSLLHWSGKGKPWVRIDEGRPCPVDRLWVPYDLRRTFRLS